MGFSIWRWLQPKNGTVASGLEEIACKELMECALDYQVRELAFWSCVNLVSKLFSRCEFRTFQDGREIRGEEYWLWNFEPNVNQDASAFRMKAVAKLFVDGEVLIVPLRRRDGKTSLAVAESWEDPAWVPSAQNEYKNVVVFDTHMDRRFRESEVIHVRLSQEANMRKVTAGIYESWYKLVIASQKAFGWANGQHWKVHVNQVAAGETGWAQKFQEMMSAQIKPFMESNSAILPEFDGYSYSNVGGIEGVAAKASTRDIRALVDDILSFTALGFNIPPVLLSSQASVGEADGRMLRDALDPICSAFSREITRKRYGFDLWKENSFLQVDSSAVGHFDLFNGAAAIEKLIGSGWSFNDLRRKLGEPLIQEPWADQHFLTKNFGSVTAAPAAEEGANNNA